MQLSIIVPVYNMAADGKLKYCLDSLIKQSISDYEILAIDDCSTDESLSILKEYEAHYPEKFRCFTSPINKHQGGAKNIGLRAAKGEWIGFIDSDDWVVPNFYEKLLQKAAETGADLVGCDYCLTEEHSMKVGQIVANNKMEQTGLLDDAKRRSLILDGGSLVVKIFKRKMILEHQLFFPENIFYEDNALGNSYLILAHQFAYLPEPLYFYYQHSNSTVHTISQKRCEDRMEAARIMIANAKTEGYYEKYKPELEYSFVLLHYMNTLFSYMMGVRFPKYHFVKQMGQELLSYFPNFMENPYYLERTNAENKKLIRMEIRHPLFFMIYHKLLWAYRHFHTGKK